jgi:hypothetical protein
MVHYVAIDGFQLLVVAQHVTETACEAVARSVKKKRKWKIDTVNYLKVVGISNVMEDYTRRVVPFVSVGTTLVNRSGLVVAIVRGMISVVAVVMLGIKGG